MLLSIKKEPFEKLKFSTNFYGTLYSKKTILNEYYKDFPNGIYSCYKNKATIEGIFRKYKRQFHTNLTNSHDDQGNFDQDKLIASTILFISQIECSHFFINGNNRLSCQLLLNKLLIDYKVFPSANGMTGEGWILFIPNGFSHYALSHLYQYMENNKARYLISGVSELTKAFSDVIKWVKFGNECWEMMLDA